MPTPTGLLKVNDIIFNTVTKRRWKVIARLGNDAAYSVRIVPMDEALPPDSRNRGYVILTETPYHLKNGWKVLM